MAEIAESAERLAKAGVELVGTTVNTTIKLAHDVWQDSKILALRRGISLAKLIENTLRRELKEEEEKKK
ncbi:hypothetical protein ES703_09296 [subsurface metagenome]